MGGGFLVITMSHPTLSCDVDEAVKSKSAQLKLKIGLSLTKYNTMMKGFVTDCHWVSLQIVKICMVW